MELLDRTFKITERGSTIRIEVIAGITTFMTMAYIIFVNPSLLSQAGMPFDALLVSTCLAAAIATVLMAFLANYPVALASGMGLNAFFAFTVVIGMGVAWQTALTAIFVEGILFIILTISRVREDVINCIPLSLKYGITAGIGLFIAFIGFQGGGLVVDSPATLVTQSAVRGNASAILTLAGLFIITALESKKVRGAILWGIALVTIAAIPLGVAQMPTSIVAMPPSIAPIFMQLDFSAISFDVSHENVANFWIVLFTFFFVDFFDTVGTLVGVASSSDLLDDKGHLKNARGALLADAIGTCAGAALGVSTVTSYVESASGVSVGGRTGLSALTTAILFLLAIFFSPLVSIVPPCATAPALIVVGVHMLMSIRKIDFSDWTEMLPSVMPAFAMPFCYSIASGIELGLFSYAAVKLLSGRVKEVSPIVWVLAVIFALKELFI